MIKIIVTFHRCVKFWTHLLCEYVYVLFLRIELVCCDDCIAVIPKVQLYLFFFSSDYNNNENSVYKFMY